MDVISYCVSSAAQPQSTVTCFVGKTYPFHFFGLLVSYLAKKLEAPLTRLDVTQLSADEVCTQLGMSFLGQQQRYWLVGIHELEKKQLGKLIGYLNAYQGPHALYFFVTEEQARLLQHAQCITVNDVVTRADYQQLAHEVYDISARSPFTKKLFDVYDRLSLDDASLLLSYQKVVGRSTKEFFDSWLTTILLPDASLFALSQDFFAKQGESFFARWMQIKDAYHEMFWLAYWSDQLFKAATYVALMKQGDRVEAKKIGYRLPFSFLQKEWRSYQPDELRAAHAMLYTIDYHLKNGGQPDSLELLYSKFLQGQFNDTSK